MARCSVLVPFTCLLRCQVGRVVLYPPNVRVAQVVSSCLARCSHPNEWKAGSEDLVRSRSAGLMYECGGEPNSTVNPAPVSNHGATARSCAQLTRTLIWFATVAQVGVWRPVGGERLVCQSPDRDWEIALAGECSALHLLAQCTDAAL